MQQTRGLAVFPKAKQATGATPRDYVFVYYVLTQKISRCSQFDYKLLHEVFYKFSLQFL